MFYKIFLKILIILTCCLFSFGVFALQNSSVNFFCPETITCHVTDLNHPNCSSLPANWFISAVAIGGYPQIGNPTILHFTNAQSNNDSSNCNYSFNNKPNGFYNIALSSYHYFAPNDISGTQWKPGNNGVTKDYCYSLGLEESKPNDSYQCPYIASQHK